MLFQSDSLHHSLDSDDPPSVWDSFLSTGEDPVPVASDDLRSELHSFVSELPSSVFISHHKAEMICSKQSEQKRLVSIFGRLLIGHSMANFFPVARALAAPLLNRVYFRLKSLLSASSESSVRTSSVGLCRYGRDLLQTSELQLCQLMRFICWITWPI